MHEYGSDSYSTGDPLNRTAEEMFHLMKEKNIDYFFGNITQQTVVMLERFAEANGGPVATFNIGHGRGRRFGGWLFVGLSNVVWFVMTSVTDT